MSINMLRFGGINGATGRNLADKPTPEEQAQVRKGIIDNLPKTVKTLQDKAKELAQVTKDLEGIAANLAPLQADYFDKAYPDNHPVCFAPPGMGK